MHSPACHSTEAPSPLHMYIVYRNFLLHVGRHSTSTFLVNRKLDPYHIEKLYVTPPLIFYAKQRV